MTQRWSQRFLSLTLAAALYVCPSARAQDCNGNGVPDAADVADGASADCNENLVPDECELRSDRFVVRSAFAVRSGPRASILRDFNGDGLLDLATGNVEAGSSSVSVLLNAGSRIFTREDYPVGENLLGLSAGDADGDGSIDIVVLEDAAIHVLMNDGSGAFDGGVAIPVADGASDLAIGDLNGDRSADVVLSYRRANAVSVLLGAGNGDFTAPQDLEVGEFPAALLLADVDNDGDDDIVTSNLRSGEIVTLLNDGSGLFTRGTRTEVPAPLDMTAADFDGDGRSDLAVTSGAAVVILLSDEAAGFRKASVFLLPGRPDSVGAGDVDGDGDLDLFAVASGSKAIHVLVNAGDGAFRASFVEEVGGTPTSLTSGDMDGDGDLDLVVTQANSAQILWNAEVATLSSSPGVPVGADPHSAALGDLDGDGDLDVITADGGVDKSLTILTNDGEGSLEVRETINTFSYLNSVAAADFDGDGDLDLATGDHAGRGVLVLLNGGAGNLGEPTKYRTEAQSFLVTTGDLDGDGDEDIVSASDTDNRISVLLNNGDGRFASASEVNVGDRPLCATPGDFDLDGDLDLAVAHAGSSSFGLWVLNNDGTGNFRDVQEYDIESPYYVGAADLDGDGDLDLATANHEGESVSVLLNRGDGTFALDAVYPIAQVPHSLILADLNGDGLADVITANQVADSVSFLANEGGGRLAAPLHFKVGDGPRYVVAGDLDADGDLDVVSANHSSADVTVLYNQMQGARGEPFLERICTEAEFHRVSRQSTQTGVARLSKYMVPADPDDPGLLSALFQNVGRFETHLEFLRELFPERFPGLDVETYNRLVNLRVTRKYFVGVLFLLRTEAGPLYGFNVLGDFSRTDELPTVDEVRGVYESLREVFALTPLAYYPDDPLAREDAARWTEPGFEIYLEDPAADVEYAAYTRAVGFGTVRILDAEAFQEANESGRISFQDILVLDRAPRDIEGVVSGVITAEPQGELSHVAIRTARRGTPNAFVRGALEEFAPFAETLVRLEVREGEYLVEAATVEEAQDWWDSSRPRLSVLPSIDPEFSEFPTLDEIAALEVADEEIPSEARFGGKAAYFARLQSILHGEFERYREPGFAIPLPYYLEFMRSNVIPSVLDPERTVTYEEFLAELFSDETFLSDSSFRFEVLEYFRDYSRAFGVVPEGLVRSLALRIAEVFGTTTDRVRFRSSSNVEDALEFNGAGLYDSTSVCAADDLDAGNGGPSRCDPTRDDERGVARGLKKVWASLWNFRAYEERAFFGIPQDQIAMAVLVTRAFVDERANGVAFTGNPTNPSDGRYVVTVQTGENSVVSPEPGQIPEKDLLTVEDGRVLEIVRAASSSLVVPGEHVLTDAQLEELGALLWHIDQNLPVDLGGHARREVILDAELKLEPDESLAVKQVRPFLITSPALPTPTFELEIPPGTRVCSGFNGLRRLGDSPREWYEVKSSILLAGGTIPLPTVRETFQSELFEEVRLGPDEEVLAPRGPGSFNLRRSARGDELIFTFEYRQEFTLPGGEPYDLVLSDLVFRTRADGSADERAIVLDEEYLTHGLGLRGEAEKLVPYSSCSYEVLPLWEVEVGAADGSTVWLLERFDPPPPGEDKTGAASLIEAEIDLRGAQRTVTGYWHLVYSAFRHNTFRRYWVVLEPPLEVPGIERRAHIVEIVAPQDDTQGDRLVEPEVILLDERFEVITSQVVTSYRMGRVSEPAQPLFRRGDVTADGSVNVTDVVVLLGALFQGGGALLTCQKAADANDDGTLNVSDAVGVLVHLFHAAGPLPPPFSECGSDPTDDALTCTDFAFCGQ